MQAQDVDSADYMLTIDFQCLACGACFSLPSNLEGLCRRSLTDPAENPEALQPRPPSSPPAHL
eukprot:1159202-Pelagomonas_calceolata.AAC.3